ncbi:MAG: hypothetical protein DSM106950_05850 [Stigonema ocellatum SAG 48.90 = DSM 106950]|nr:hypothetical protein [Stigonema ocellatum SAG 48.90 = DSM 106950]
MKLLMYRHAVLVACFLALLLLPAGCYQVSVSFEPSNSETETPSPPPTQPSQLEKTETLSVSQEKANVPTVPTPASTPKNSVLISYNNSSRKGLQQGSLRMSNQTQKPVRLALLARRSVVKGSDSQKSNYDVPAHWDFSPKEGSEKGLILSLPNGNLKLEKGDILVAFAQDSSRRYWGPYVVGETSLPTWNAQNREWQLLLTK